MKYFTNKSIVRFLSRALLLTSALASALTSAEVTITYYHNDLLGSPVAATDEQGKVIWRKSYAPYGELLNQNVTDDDIGFTGHKQDKEIGLTYAGARYYDQRLGRFTGIDAVGVLGSVASNPMMFNRYAYANNNPYKYVDPDGRSNVLAYTPISSTAGVTGMQNLSLAQQGEGVMLMLSLSPLAGGEMLAAKVLGRVFKVVKGVGKVAKSGSGAVNNASKVKLEKQLASQEQLGQLSNGGGTVISQPAKQANRIASQTGRNPANIQKVSSDARVARDGQQVQTHSFRDASTNELIEPKTIIGD